VLKRLLPRENKNASLHASSTFARYTEWLYVLSPSAQVSYMPYVLGCHTLRTFYLHKKSPSTRSLDDKVDFGTSLRGEIRQVEILLQIIIKAKHLADNEVFKEGGH
jgi:hypothetical protein